MHLEYFKENIYCTFIKLIKRVLFQLQRMIYKQIALGNALNTLEDISSPHSDTNTCPTDIRTGECKNMTFPGNISTERLINSPTHCRRNTMCIEHKYPLRERRRV